MCSRQFSVLNQLQDLIVLLLICTTRCRCVVVLLDLSKAVVVTNII